jgi:hypothetical protein
MEAQALVTKVQGLWDLIIHSGQPAIPFNRLLEIPTPAPFPSTYTYSLNASHLHHVEIQQQVDFKREARLLTSVTKLFFR